jgi:CubicO group peptidase (beta-lactamase class C family)
MNRRTFLVSAASALGLTNLTALSIRGAPLGNPSFDPSYSNLPTLAQQTKDLGAEALDAQTKSQSHDGLPVTGLPHKLSKAEEGIAAHVKASGMVGVSYAISVGKTLVLTRGLGHLSNYEKNAVTPTSPGYLGSITKPLCGVTALMLVKSGKLKLDQKVMDVLPMEPLLKPGEKRQPEIDHVTIRMLMNHTSGLFNVVEELFDRAYYKELADQRKLTLVHGDISQYDLVRRGMSKPFVAQPGKAFNYSGEGFQVLGRVIEKITGERLDKAMSSLVLKPMGVKHHATLSCLDRETYTHLASGAGSKTLSLIPSPYIAALGKCATWHFTDPIEDLYGNHWGQADACGSSMLSAVDLLRFVTFCMDPLGKELTHEALNPPEKKPGSNGLGWGVSMTSGKHQYGHGGAWQGIRAFCESTWDGVQYAVLASADQDGPFDKLVESVASLGRALSAKKAAKIGWQEYGFN